jgi:hypothetical protein
MKSVDIKPVIILISVCVLIGAGVQYFTDFYWVTATLLMMVVLLINGLIIFNEDTEIGGFDYQEGVTDTPDAKKEQRKANRIQVGIIILLIIGAVWSYL